ncbi:FecR family protein [Longitalea luteola]|uniref:FecR family protein n=1 Tax=Longitalea luteola TaxID=2812563 RepID=UPI001A978FE7|nr:FecR family protein [Longitalea luteola]
MNEQLATDLLRRFSSGETSAAEEQLVDAWYQELINTGELQWEEGEKESVQATMETSLLQSIEAAEEMPYAPVRRFRGRTWWTAAAVLIIVSGAGYYLMKKQPAASGVAKTDVLVNDVAPGTNKAVLTLADGTTIDLDNAANGMIAKQDNAEVLKPEEGQLVYSPDDSNKGEGPLSWNSLATPRSGQYQLALPDGSKVWLNAQSSIHYPIAFRGNERRVQITGEVYFEVAHNPKMPFIVEKGDMRVEVLGTHFNVNAYNDESAIKTTLLEGKVKVVKGGSVRSTSAVNDQTAILRPGEQAVIPAGSARTKQSVNNQIQVRKTDVDDVVAWKNGLFHFENADVRTVMRQLARWYDVEVVYQGASVKNDPLFVEISRNTRLSDVLKVLEESGSAKFSIQGRKVIVK